MSITSAKTGSTSLSLALENNFMEPIASALVGAGSANQVTFLDIPQGYKHLQIRGIARSTYAGGATRAGFITFNNDSATNYSIHQISGNGSATESWGTSSTNQAHWQRIATATAGASMFGGLIIDILDYSNANKNTTVRGIGGTDQNGSGEIYQTSCAWYNKDPITSIKLYPQDENWAQHSRFSLYGIKG
jgi:hypothetical protein